jgi:hypothetical protein
MDAMLGRKSVTRDEVDHARASIDQQVSSAFFVELERKFL